MARSGFRGRTMLVWSLPWAAALLTGAAHAPAERVIQPEELVPISVNGQARTARIEPGAPGLMLLTQPYAEAAQLKPGGLLHIEVGYVVGDQHVLGKTAVAQVGWNAARPEKRRVAWTPRPFATGVDAVVGPAGVDAPVVRFVLHPVREGERTVSLPMAPVSALFGSWFGLRAQMAVGGSPLLVRFDPYHRRTVANALAGQRLAAALGGRFDGPANEEEIAFGIARPVRPLALARPLVVGPLALSRLGVRTVPDLHNGGSIAGIKEAGDPDEAADPNDVVVTAKRKGKPRPGTLTLGADELDRCSSLVFDKPKKEIRFTCG